MSLIFFGAVLAFAQAPVFAQQQTIVLQSGGKNAIQIPDDQKLMFQAAGKVMQRDYTAAETLYTQAITLNNGNLDAYLQRALIRRELKNVAGTDADARMVVALANNRLQRGDNPSLYYSRGMALRLLKQFEPAKNDIRYAMRIGGQPGWQTDLKAIELEQKQGN